MVQRWEKLSDIKYNNTHITLFNLSSSYQVDQIKSYVNGLFLLNTTQLIGVKKTIDHGMELKSVADDLLNEFICSIEENDWSKCLWRAISQFVELGNDNRY